MKKVCHKMHRLHKTPSFREKRPPTGRPFFVGIRLPCRESGLPRQCAHWLAMTGMCKMSILQQTLFRSKKRNTSLLASVSSGGATQNRTGDGDFADLCLTAWLWRRMYRWYGTTSLCPARRPDAEKKLERVTRLELASAPTKALLLRGPHLLISPPTARRGRGWRQRVLRCPPF